MKERSMSDPKLLIDKIKALPPDHLPEVEDFVDSIAAQAQNRALGRAAVAASAPAFAEVWNNPEDDVYDEL
jgi:hypothetical protein